MKKILVISQNHTPPVYAGNQKCIFEYCEMLKGLNADVSFLYLQGHKKLAQEEFDILHRYWGDNLHIYNRKITLEAPIRLWGKIRACFTPFNFLDEKYPFGLTSYVQELQKKHHFDIIIINYLTLSRLFIGKLDCHKVLFAHDCFTFKNERLHTDKSFFNLKPNDEARALRRCDTVLSIQDNETTLFEYLAPDCRVKTVYSIFPTQWVKSDLPNENILFFSGDSQLNINGIKRFINHIFPLVLDKHPQARLIIAGNICNKLNDIQHSNITQLGRIDDVKQFYSMGEIAINPIYQGTGLKIKTLEALSYGKATVVDPHSIEGLYKATSAPTLVGHTYNEYAQHIISLLEQPSLRNKLAQEGIAYVDEMNEYIKKQYKELIAL